MKEAKNIKIVNAKVFDNSRCNQSLVIVRIEKARKKNRETYKQIQTFHVHNPAKTQFKINEIIKIQPTRKISKKKFYIVVEDGVK